MFNIVLILYGLNDLFQIKVYDPLTKTCSTLSGTGLPGLRDGGLTEAQFSEPAGVCLADGGKTLFVSDTNNHCIRKIDLEKKMVETVRHIVTVELFWLILSFYFVKF